MYGLAGILVMLVSTMLILIWLPNYCSGAFCNIHKTRLGPASGLKKRKKSRTCAFQKCRYIKGGLSSLYTAYRSFVLSCHFRCEDDLWEADTGTWFWDSWKWERLSIEPPVFHQVVHHLLQTSRLCSSHLPRQLCCHLVWLFSCLCLAGTVLQLWSDPSKLSLSTKYHKLKNTWINSDLGSVPAHCHCCLWSLDLIPRMARYVRDCNLPMNYKRKPDQHDLSLSALHS